MKMLPRRADRWSCCSMGFVRTRNVRFPFPGSLRRRKGNRWTIARRRSSARRSKPRRTARQRGKEQRRMKSLDRSREKKDSNCEWTVSLTIVFYRHRSDKGRERWYQIYLHLERSENTTRDDYMSFVISHKDVRGRWRQLSAATSTRSSRRINRQSLETIWTDLLTEREAGAGNEFECWSRCLTTCFNILGFMASMESLLFRWGFSWHCCSTKELSIMTHFDTR